METSVEVVNVTVEYHDTSLNTNTFPSFWKRANVIPPAQDKATVTNYRPVSLLRVGKVIGLENCLIVFK